MNIRRETLLVLSAIAALGVAPAFAQVRSRPVRIATLHPGRYGEDAHLWATFRKRLQELGYAEGSGYVIDPRWGEADAQRLDALARDAVAQKPDVIVTANTLTALAAKRATSTIPIVSIGGAAPVEAGLIDSYDRPGGNVTGVTTLLAEAAGKWIEALHEVAPRAKAVAYLAGDLRNPAAQQIVAELRKAATPRGLAIETFSGGDPEAIRAAFDAMARQKMQALIVTGAAGQRTRAIVDGTRRLRIPAIYARREFTEAGGLMSYTTDFNAMYARAADYVHRVIQGTSPAALPFERVSTFELVINLKTARDLGLTVPPSLLLRATRVIE